MRPAFQRSTSLCSIKRVATCRRQILSASTTTLPKQANYDAIESKFRMPSGFWSNKKNHQVFLNWAAKKLKIKEYNDWYQVSSETIDDLGGHRMLHHYYNSSLALALQSVYPEKEWLPWKFSAGVPNGYWQDITNRRRFFDWLKTQLNIQTQEQWYSVKASDVVAHGGRHILKSFYHGSVALACLDIYPELEWHPWRFPGGVPTGYWNNERNVVKFVKYIMDYYSLQVEDLRWISAKNIRDIGGGSLLTKIGGWDAFVKKYFPAFEPSKISKGQFRLHQVLRSLFPEHQVIMNYRIPATRYHSCELDVFIPRFNLGFEFQGEYHYQWNYLHGAPEEQQKRDQQKKEICKESNITLIEVPFWWDKKQSSLAATIQTIRPDVALGVDPTAQPIQTEVPQKVLEASRRMQLKKTLQQGEMELNDLRSIPYALTVTSYRSKCYHCKTVLTQGELKITAHGLFKASDSVPYRAKYSLCCKKECVSHPTENPKIVFPPFNNQIAVPKVTKEYLDAAKVQLDDKLGVQWVYL